MPEIKYKRVMLKVSGEALAGEEVQAVAVGLVKGDLGRIGVGIYRTDNGLEHNGRAVLNELTERVEICRKNYRCRENTLAVLAFGFAVQLLPPFNKVLKLRFIIHKHLELMIKLFNLLIVLKKEL